MAKYEWRTERGNVGAGADEELNKLENEGWEIFATHAVLVPTQMISNISLVIVARRELKKAS